MICPRICLAVALLFLGCLSGCSRQGPDEWLANNGGGWAAYVKGDLGDAETRLKAAVEEADKAGASRRLALSLTNLAWVNEKQRKYDEATTNGERALTVFKELNRDGDVDKARCLYTLARSYERQKKYDRAEDCYKQAIDVARHEKAFGEKHPVTAQIESGLGALYDVQGRFDEAERLHAQALQIVKDASLSKEEHSRMAAACYENAANHYRLKGDFTKAVAEEEKAVKILKKPLKKSDPQMVSAAHTLATLQSQQGKKAEAAKQLKDSVETLRNSDKTKLVLAQTLHDLGTVSYELGDYKAGKTYLAEALDIRKKELGEKDLKVASTLRALANLEKASGQSSEAMRDYKEVLAIKEASLGTEDLSLATDLESLASLRAKRFKQYSIAEGEFKRALAIREKALGPDHRLVAATMHNLANLHRDSQKRDKYPEAEDLYKKSLALKEKALGPNSPQVAKVLDSYAQFLKQVGRDSEAADVKARSTQIKKLNQKKEQPSRKG